MTPAADPQPVVIFELAKPRMQQCPAADHMLMHAPPHGLIRPCRAAPCPQVIRGLLGEKNFVIIVEHDLSVLDYLSDFICCLYGKPGAYGVVTMPFSVRWGQRGSAWLQP